MHVRLTVTAGPHAGKAFAFDGHDTFLVGRSKDAHFQLAHNDPYFSRRHFLVEVNPPRCRVLDLKSRNGTHVNGRKVDAAELSHGDEVRAGHTVFQVEIVRPDPDAVATLGLPAAAPPVPTTNYVPGTATIPGYALGPELGRGGMGVVYRADRLADGAAVAVKTVLPAQGVSQKQVDRFLREAEILGKLRHRHIVAFHEAGTAGPLIYLVMELVPGPDAEAVLHERGPLDVKTAVRIACQMLAGLAHAHGKGYVHRDVKPGNLLIGRAGNKRVVKLADFGLARAFEMSRLSGLTLQGEVGGTPAFMAPEQVTHYREAKPTADQYSAAATLYRLLTGKFVHDLPGTVAQQLVHIMTEPPVPIRSRRPDLPEELAVVIHKSLSREPADRYPSVGGLRTALLPFG
jgi:serine/threonine-protein kinase